MASNALCTKRPLEAIYEPMQTCSPHRIESINSNAFRKRARRTESMEERSVVSQRESYFQTSQEFKAEEFLEEQYKSPIAFEHEDMEEKDERMYSAYEVKVMVEKAVESREKTLREEYDRILQGLLQEQYNNFVKFNEDHISRRLRNSDFSYIS